MKNNKLKKALLILPITLVLLVVGKTISDAANFSLSGASIGKNVYINRLRRQDNLYCTQQQTNYHSGYYTVTNYMKITGNKATDNKNRTVENSANLKLAYILGASNAGPTGEYQNGKYTARQKAVWAYWNTWKNQVGNKFGINWTTYPGGSHGTNYSNDADCKNLLKAADNYVANDGKASITSLVGREIVTSNTIAGPIRVKYTGTISSIIVRDNTGSVIQNGIQFFTDRNGKNAINARNIRSGQEFYIKNTSGKILNNITVNVQANSTVNVEIWILKNIKSSSQRLMLVKPSTEKTMATITIGLKTYGSLSIYKQDADNNNIRLTAGFKIQTSKGWLRGTKGSYQYVSNPVMAETYRTNASNGGRIVLEELEYGKYKIYETESPEGYELSLQNGYDSKNNWVFIGETNLSGTNIDAKIIGRNTKPISISGFVWIDAQRTKKNDTNSEYDSKEARIAGVTVRLVNKSNRNVIATTITNANGEYVFNARDIRQVTESTVKNYFVEFDYSGTQYRNYIPVAFNSVNSNEIKENGSRAIAENMPVKDSDFKGIAKTYTGTNKETTYGLSGNIYNRLFDKSTNTLKNINLGIKQLPETEYAIDESLAFVKITMKGYTYTYNYRGTGEIKTAAAAPQVKWQNGEVISAYSRAIYPSDIAYDKINSTEELNVKVTYRIDITNTTNYDMEELYQEQKLHITSLTNKFDIKRYDLSDNRWSANGDTAKISDNYLKQIYGNGINKNETKTALIEFSVKKQAILDILNHPNGIIEDLPTEAIANGYHEYTRKDYSWQNDITKNQTHETSNQTRNSKAPYIIFKLGEERTITGKVFEDKVVTTNGEKLGNGIYENDENVAEGVKVELLDDANGLPLSNLYIAEGDGSVPISTISIPAEVKTDKNGVFTLKGVVPGYYYLRFTYGDGTQKLYDASGNEIKQISSKEYKSTIVTSEVAKNAIKNQNNIYMEQWYKHLENENCSVAIDNLNIRKNMTEQLNVPATIAKISITIENTIEDSTNIASAEETGSKQIFNGFNFGIIEQPKQDAKIEKVITNIKLVNAQGNLIFEGNPANAKMKGVSDLNKTSNEGSTYVRAEIEPETVYGSTLSVSYGIKVTNTSDVNYYTNNYYWFGEDKTAEVTLQIDKVIDYLDSTLKFQSIDNDHKAEEIELNGKKVLQITGWKKLYTEKRTDRSVQKTTTDTAQIVVQRILSSQDDDMEVINEAEMTSAIRATDPDDTSTDKEERIKIIPITNISAKGKATLTVTPPTGLDKLAIILYIIAGTAGLAILSAGIITIKKKIVE